MGSGNSKAVSKQALCRMPYYLNYLRELEDNGVEYVSAPEIAAALDLNGVQVRKDLASASEEAGIPKKGYRVPCLVKGMERLLGYDNMETAVLVGAGHLGSALLSFKGFEEFGLDIAAAFDKNAAIVGTRINSKPVYHIDTLSGYCLSHNIRLAIITLPAEAAQSVCDMLIESGVLAIWNFAHTHLKVPKGILVHNENMAASLALLSHHLEEKLKES